MMGKAARIGVETLLAVEEMLEGVVGGIPDVGLGDSAAASHAFCPLQAWCACCAKYRMAVLRRAGQQRLIRSKHAAPSGQLLAEASLALKLSLDGTLVLPTTIRGHTTTAAASSKRRGASDTPTHSKRSGHPLREGCRAS